MFVQKIKGFIEDNSLFSTNDRILVGLSGGADSVALLIVLRENGADCVAVHCNFHLRGDESDRDETFCRDLTSQLNVPLIVKDFDVEERRRTTGESVEMACRSLRYEWWKNLMREGAANLVAVGHHRDDNIETFFLNLLRGSGLKGLKGMLPKQGAVIRPLLDVSRDEIEAFLAGRGIKFVIDSTNREDIYKRNKLRLNLLPQLNELFPGALDAISGSISHLRDNNALYQDYIRMLREKYVENDGRINIGKLIQESPAPETAVFELINPLGMNSTHSHDIIESVLKGSTGSRSFGSYLLHRGVLYPPELKPAPELYLRIMNISVESFRTLRRDGRLDRNSLYLDSDLIDPQQLTVREWHEGDRIAPFGMKGTRLVSDIMSDAKLTANEKHMVRIVETEGKILWVTGLRTSRHYAVTPSTKNVAVVTLIPKDK